MESSLPENGDLSNIRILHVDDNPDDLELTAFRLKRLSEDLEIVEAGSVSEALEALEGSKFDCILCDYCMPGRSGLELLESLRRSGSDVPFIMVSSFYNEAVALKVRQSETSDYLEKDYRAEYYAELLGAILNIVVYRNRTAVAG